jgi:endo-1,4-beta-xylanase
MQTMNRRSLLLAGASFGALAASSRLPSAAEPGLGEIAAENGILFGSWVRGSSLVGLPPYAAMVARECRLIVSGVEMQWAAVSPDAMTTNFSKVDAVDGWARVHRMKLRGHALVWHGQVPHWFVDLPDRASAERAMTGHIQTMCRHFAGRIQSWDVVNEAIQASDHRPDGLRKTAFLEKIGPEYLDIAFRAARETDPRALLVLNEFHIEYDIPDHHNRQRALLTLIDGLLKRNVPLDAIGFQSHLALGDNPRFNERMLADFTKEISSRNLKIMITEMDVVDRAAPSDVAVRDAQVAALYKRYLDVMLDNHALVGVVTWGLTDGDSWITRGDSPAFRRTDDLPPRPLPFDADYRQKPCYDAIAQALRAAPKR